MGLSRMTDHNRREPDGYRRLSLGIRHLLQERDRTDPAMWRTRLRQLMADGRREQLQPEHVLVVVKSEWAMHHQGDGHPARTTDELNRLVTLCIECYYHGDGDAPGGASPSFPAEPSRGD